MREYIIEHERLNGRSVQETGITVDDLLKADEIFLTDVIHGLRWVGAFRHKRYFNTTSRKLLNAIQEAQTKKV